MAVDASTIVGRVGTTAELFISDAKKEMKRVQQQNNLLGFIV